MYVDTVKSDGSTVGRVGTTDKKNISKLYQ